MARGEQQLVDSLLRPVLFSGWPVIALASMNKLLSQVLHVIIYTCGTFYALPAKNLLVLASSASFRRSYHHFRRDHSDPLNLAIHLGCLVAQLLGNFGLLALLDALCGTQQLISLSTAAVWITTIVVGAGKDMPWSVGVLTVACIAGGYAVREAVLQQWRVLALVHVLCEGPNAWYISRHLLHRPLTVPACFVLTLIRLGFFTLCLTYEGTFC